MTEPVPVPVVLPPTVCVKPSPSTDRFGVPCSACGHTNLAHPNPGNPGLTACALCRVGLAVHEYGVAMARVAHAFDTMTEATRRLTESGTPA